MAFNNVPVNGWPQIKDLEKLDALANQIENMPTFTSNDKAFLENLPSYPSEDGKKALVATTSSGDTSLNYEELSDLPADPETDGVRVLTATTSNGDTVKSWEMKNNIDFSTTEHATGLKWIDGREIYSVTVDNTSDLVIQSNTWTDTSIVKGSIDLIIAVLGTSNGGSTFPLAGDKGATYIRVNSWRNDTVSVRYITLFYTKTT